jgi:hypothetical protein
MKLLLLFFFADLRGKSQYLQLKIYHSGEERWKIVLEGEKERI